MTTSTRFAISFLFTALATTTACTTTADGTADESGEAPGGGKGDCTDCAPPPSGPRPFSLIEPRLTYRTQGRRIGLNIAFAGVSL